MRTATLNDWSPKRAHSFCKRRIDKIRHLLVEIGGCYGDVDQCVVDCADDLIAATKDLEEQLDVALAEGRSL